MTDVGDMAALRAPSRVNPLGPYETLTRWVGELQEERAVRALPESVDAQDAGYEEDISQGAAYVDAHRKTIAKRLWMLGYLADCPSARDAGAISNQQYKAAIEQFQFDTDQAFDPLKPDGWAGKKTWAALQKLVSFETELDVEQWCRDCTPCKALVRASLLRLRSMGLVNSDVFDRLKAGGVNSVDLLDGLSRFRSTSIELGILPSNIAEINPWPDDAWPELISRLFDQDSMVKALAERFDRNLDPADWRNAEGGDRFAVCVARIELWLAGYSVRPMGWGGEDSDDVVERLERSLKILAAQLGEAPGCINRLLFMRLTEDDNEKPHDMAIAKKLLVDADRMEVEEGGWVTKVWDRAKLLASRCFDGIRRAWRWLKREACRVFDVVRHSIQNLWRTTVKWLSHRFGRIADVLNAVSEGIHGAVENAVGFDDIPTAALFRDFDYDTILCADPENPQHARMLVKRYGLRAKLLELSLNLLREFLEIVGDLVKIAGAASTGLGLLVVAYALYQLWQNIGDIQDEIEQLLVVHAEFRAT